MQTSRSVCRKNHQISASDQAIVVLQTINYDLEYRLIHLLYEFLILLDYKVTKTLIEKHLPCKKNRNGKSKYKSLTDACQEETGIPIGLLEPAQND